METGELDRMIEAGLRGMTSNPSIFENAIGGSDLYDEAIGDILSRAPHASVLETYEALAIADIQSACDAFLTVHAATGGRDGFVSFEVTPDLAHDTEQTIAEARRLWAAVSRPNLMIKVPATPAGIPAIEELIADGINVNVTLIFSLRHYEHVAQAFLRGIDRSSNPGSVASVASVFISRIDAVIDPLLESNGSDAAASLLGRVAVANCKSVYRRASELFGDDFEAVWGRGVAPQRPLWASTGTKNPAYSDVKYVEELVDRGTVNTVPPKTLAAFEDHGTVVPGMAGHDVDRAEADLALLASLGIDLDAVCQDLQDRGVVAFMDAFSGLLGAIDTKQQRFLARA
jgi:transaldolase